MPSLGWTFATASLGYTDVDFGWITFVCVVEGAGCSGEVGSCNISPAIRDWSRVNLMSSVDFVGITGQGWELPQALDAWSYYTAGRYYT